MRSFLIGTAVAIAALTIVSAGEAKALPAAGCVVNAQVSKAFPGFFHFTMSGCKSMSSMDVSAVEPIQKSTAWAVMTSKDERGVGAILLNQGKEHVLFEPYTAPGDSLYVDIDGLKVGDVVTFKAKSATGGNLAPFTYTISNKSSSK